MTRNSTAMILLVAAGAWFVLGQPVASTHDATRPEPALQVAVAPVRAVELDAADRVQLAGFYLALADVVGRDAELITSTRALRDIHVRAGRLCFQQTGAAGKYPALAERIDAFLAARLGLDNVALDAAKRAEAVASLRALAWAVGG